MLIAAKTLTNQTTEVGPILPRDLAFSRLEPTASGSGELHSRALHPHGWVESVEIKVVLSTSHPILGVIAIEFREVHLGKVVESCGMGCGDAMGRS
jgi:hypothetical protein